MDLVALLIKRLADVNGNICPFRISDMRFYVPPLHEAADVGHVKVAALLIKHGADINIKNGGGKTPLDHARLANKNDIVSLLKKHGAKK